MNSPQISSFEGMLTYTPAMNSFLRFLFLVFVSSHSIQAVEPLISSLLPRGGMRDSEQQVVVRGQRLDKAAEFFFYSEGIEVSKIVEGKIHRPSRRLSPFRKRRLRSAQTENSHQRRSEQPLHLLGRTISQRPREGTQLRF